MMIQGRDASDHEKGQTLKRLGIVGNVRNVVMSVCRSAFRLPYVVQASDCRQRDTANALHLCVTLAGNMGLTGHIQTYGTVDETMARITHRITATAKKLNRILNSRGLVSGMAMIPVSAVDDRLPSPHFAHDPRFRTLPFS